MVFSEITGFGNYCSLRPETLQMQTTYEVNKGVWVFKVKVISWWLNTPRSGFRWAFSGPMVLWLKLLLLWVIVSCFVVLHSEWCLNIIESEILSSCQKFPTFLIRRRFETTYWVRKNSINVACSFVTSNLIHALWRQRHTSTRPKISENVTYKYKISPDAP